MYIGSDGFTTLVTGSMDKKILKPITGRLKAYSMLFLPLLERHDLLLYRNPFHVSFFFYWLSLERLVYRCAQIITWLDCLKPPQKGLFQRYRRRDNWLERILLCVFSIFCVKVDINSVYHVYEELLKGLIKRFRQHQCLYSQFKGMLNGQLPGDQMK